MEQNQNNLTDETLADGAQLTPADGGEAVADTLSLAELNQHLGKDFKDKPTALKALKDTFSYVGKKVETTQPAPAVAEPELKSEVQALKEEVFYSQHPEYKDLRDTIKLMGGNPAEVVATPGFQALFEKVKAADAVQSTKSVVQTNNRLGQAPSHLEDAQKAFAANNTGDGLTLLARAVLEATESQV